MSVDYSKRLNDLEALLREFAPERIVTRTYKDFGQHKSEELAQGIYTVISGGISAYPSLYHAGDEGRQRVLIIFQTKVPEGSDGPTVEAAEFAALNEMEALAEQSPLIWPALVLQSAETSMQMEAPWCWVRSQWETFTDRNAA